MSLLDEAHHDGSPLYLDQPSPVLGQTVTVRRRVDHDAAWLEIRAL